MNYDFDNFLSQVKHLDKEDILMTAQRKNRSLDKPSAMPMAARLAFQKGVQGLLYWMETAKRMEGLSDQDFEKLKPICESLIRKNQLAPEAIEIFK